MQAAKTKTNKTVQMVNIWDKPITIQIGGTPGDGVTEFTIEPGKSCPFHEGYCLPVKGAGVEPMPAILARKSTRTWDDNVRRPTLVPENEAEATKTANLAAVERWKKSLPKTNGQTTAR